MLLSLPVRPRHPAVQASFCMAGFSGSPQIDKIPFIIEKLFASPFCQSTSYAEIENSKVANDLLPPFLVVSFGLANARQVEVRQPDCRITTCACQAVGFDEPEPDELAVVFGPVFDFPLSRVSLRNLYRCPLTFEVLGLPSQWALEHVVADGPKEPVRVGQNDLRQGLTFMPAKVHFGPYFLARLDRISALD